MQTVNTRKASQNISGGVSKNKYPILYKIGISEFEDKPPEAVPEHWREWHKSLKVFWKNWIDFREKYPEVKSRNSKDWVNKWINFKK
jgi:hypothetical protein